MLGGHLAVSCLVGFAETRPWKLTVGREGRFLTASFPTRQIMTGRPASPCREFPPYRPPTPNPERDPRTVSTSLGLARGGIEPTPVLWLSGSLGPLRLPHSSPLTARPCGACPWRTQEDWLLRPLAGARLPLPVGPLPHSPTPPLPAGPNTPRYAGLRHSGLFLA